MQLRSLLTAAVLATCAAAHAFDTKGWHWERPISGDLPPGFVALTLPREVLAEAQPSLDDLRVLDKNGDLVPHVIERDTAPTPAHSEPRPVQLINQTFEPRQYARAVLDFGSAVTKNQVDVDTAGTNFRRKAMLEGSTNSATWEKVAENLWLFDVSQPPHPPFRSNTLRFPTNNFRYLRLTVYHMPDDPERIEIRSVTSHMTATPPAPDAEELALPASAPTRDEKKKQTTWQFDLGSGNLPVRQLTFDIADPFFHRGYELEGRNTTTETIHTQTETAVASTQRDTPWRSVRSGVLYRVVDETTTTEHVTLQGLGSTPRYLRLRVYDADNPPLRLQRIVASVVLPRLIFSAEAGNQYRLVYGNGKVGAPQYDLAQSVRNLQATGLPSAKLGLATRLAHADEPAPWTERNATWLLLLLVAAALAMGAMVLTSLRKLPPAKD